VNDLYDPREQWASYLINAMKAKELFLKDVSYIVRNKQVVIVDEFTGRVMQVFTFALLIVWNFMLKQEEISY
jgi:preprotein translocase subunit SecA